MKFIDFVKEYPDEESCILHFRKVKEKKGIFCARCGHTSHYWIRLTGHTTARSVATELRCGAEQ